MARLGILGGTFNPPHAGHLVCARKALEQLELERVVLMPVAAPPHKRVPADPGPSARAELCELAVAGDDRLDVSRLEVDRAPPSYTVDTLRALHEERPGDDLSFIVGGDMAASLPEWREPEEVLALCTLAVAERTGHERDVVARALEPLAGAERVTFFDMPRVDVSSSLVRRRVAEGRSVSYLVGGAVAQAIATRGLYREAVSA